MSNAVEIALPKHELGDRWNTITAIGPVLIDGVTPSNNLTRVRMRFRQGATDFVLDSNGAEDAPITIDDATTWEASIPEVESFLSSTGFWKWDMKFYEATKTNPLTLYHGTLEVTDL